MSKKPNQKKQSVKVIVEGKNRVALVFPDGTDLKVKKNVSVSDLAELLRMPESDDVTGQDCGSLVAIGGVRG